MSNYLWASRFFFAIFFYWLGYISPRAVELESTAQVVFEYSITKEAADLLVRKHNTQLMECQP